MPPRFLVPDLDPTRGLAVLPDDEAYHLARVLRLGVGDHVAVFDGRGRGYAARVASLPRGRAVVTLEGELPPDPPPRVRLTLVQAALKRDAMDAVVRDATMVGVATIVPVTTERTTMPPAGVEKAGERWRRIAIASAKQCRRMSLPEILPPLAFPGWLAQPADHPRFLLREPAAEGGTVTPVRDLMQPPAPPSAAIVVGPEGGWSATEIEQALAHGCVAVSLGPLTLRADAAGLVAAGLLLALWG